MTHSDRWWQVYCAALSGMHAWTGGKGGYTIDEADDLAAEAADLAMKRDEAAPIAHPPHADRSIQRKLVWCPQCGPNATSDEDGCCTACGCDLITEAVYDQIEAIGYERGWQDAREDDALDGRR